MLQNSIQKEGINYIKIKSKFKYVAFPNFNKLLNVHKN